MVTFFPDSQAVSLRYAFGLNVLELVDESDITQHILAQAIPVGLLIQKDANALYGELDQGMRVIVILDLADVGSGKFFQLFGRIVQNRY